MTTTHTTPAPTVGGSSPWGAIQHATELAPGIISVVTASHGGIWLSDDRLDQFARIASPYKTWLEPIVGGRWFEVDLDALLPLVMFHNEIANVGRSRAIDFLTGLTAPNYSGEARYPREPALRIAAHHGIDFDAI